VVIYYLLLNIDLWGGKNGKKTHKKSKNVSLFEQKNKNLKKELQNDTFCCVFSVKVVHRIQKALSVLKLAGFRRVEIAFSK